MVHSFSILKVTREVVHVAANSISVRLFVF